MSDEAMESVPGLKPIQYTAKHYALYLDKMVEKAKHLNRGNTDSTEGSICIRAGSVGFCKSFPVDHPIGPFIHIILVVGFINQLPFFLSGSSAGLDAPQAGAVFVGHGSNRTAAALSSEGCEGWQPVGEVLRSQHWPDASKKDQNSINISTAHYFFEAYFMLVFFVYFTNMQSTIHLCSSGLI